MVWSIFEYIATFVEYAIYADFMVRFLNPKKKERSLLCFLLIFAVNSAITLIFNHFMSYEGILSVLRICANFGIAFLLLDGTTFEKLFAALILDISAMMISFLSLGTLGLLTGRTVEEMIEIRGLIRLLVLFITKALLFMVTRLLLRVKGDKRYYFSASEWITIGVIFILTMLIGLNIFQIDMDTGISSETPMSIIIGVELIMVNVLVYFLMKRISEKNAEKTNLIIDKMQDELHRTQYEEFERRFKEINQISHDMKNHLQCIETLISEKEYGRAEEYIEDMLDNKLNFKYDSVNTGNRVVDIVSNTKLMQCRNEDISVIVCSSKFETDIKDVDMCSLLGNIFDNAIEACRKVEKNREIYFEITQQKKYIHIILKNSIKKSVLESNPVLKTTKVQKKIHGYGLKSVRYIVNKYNGMIEIYEKNGLFIMDIWIPSEGF